MSLLFFNQSMQSYDYSIIVIVDVRIWISFVPVRNVRIKNRSPYMFLFLLHTFYFPESRKLKLDIF